MDRKMKIGFMIWVAFCLCVIIFAITYIVLGQIEAASQQVGLAIITNTPQIIRGL